MIAQSPLPLPKYTPCQTQQKKPCETEIKLSRSALFHTNTGVSLKYFVGTKSQF